MSVIQLAELIMAKKAKAKVKRGGAKLAASKPATGAPRNEQDIKRRLGNFSGAGEHPRQGGRTSGIVGQTKRKNKTDK
jgi:hypothetical protein